VAVDQGSLVSSNVFFFIVMYLHITVGVVEIVSVLNSELRALFAMASIL
jgi:hypothetical protein